MELTLEAVSFSRRGAPVLEDISAVIPSPGLTCLVGTNGAGKTTLLRLLCGEIRPGAGTFRIGGADTAAMTTREIQRYFSIIPQKSPAPAYLTVAEMTALGRFRSRGSLWWRLSRLDRDRVGQTLTDCGLEGFRGRRVAELSGGEQQRAWMAFALASDKPFLLLDETFDGMDVFAKQSFFEMVRSLSRRDRGVILATHDLDMVSAYADGVIVLRRGKTVYCGPGGIDLKPYLVEGAGEPDSVLS